MTPPGTLREEGVGRASPSLPVPTAWLGARALNSPFVPGPTPGHLPACQMAERVGCQCDGASAEEVEEGRGPVHRGRAQPGSRSRIPQGC